MISSAHARTRARNSLIRGVPAVARARTRSLLIILAAVSTVKTNSKNMGVLREMCSTESTSRGGNTKCAPSHVNDTHAGDTWNASRVQTLGASNLPHRKLILSRSDAISASSQWMKIT